MPHLANNPHPCIVKPPSFQLHCFLFARHPPGTGVDDFTRSRNFQATTYKGSQQRDDQHSFERIFGFPGH